ncbi:MAG: sodium:calcium antiporter [Desulfotignum sp.]|nr:sodium:calcium antiporter [Desulfotignum sp.]MCF8139061.1 sodium:calcium antiporter [Desulfotignum sp.]
MEELLLRVVPGLPTLVLLVVIGVCILLLSKGADWAIDGVVALARRTGLPRIVIGATIVSLGTTLPEAFVSVMAAWTGNPGLALGNGVGSIIADTGLILGFACVMTRVPMNRFILNRTGWVQVGSATLLVVIAVAALLIMPEPMIKREIGVLFLVLLAVYMYATYRWAKSGGDQALDGEAVDDSDEMGIPKSLMMILGGLFLVILGARVLIPCASECAVRFGVPQDVIAATLVAFGTSLPELMTAFAAIRKGHPEIMVGNVVGADVLNCLFVIGAASSARPLAIPPNFFAFHFPVMLLILYSFRVFIAMQNKKGYFERWQGGWLLGIYLIYVVLQYALNVNIPH